MRPVYMEVTQDRFELPLAVADSAYELARLLGVTVYPILHGIKKERSKYKQVWIEEEERCS